MTKPRDGLYVWVTWLSRMMAGDSKCHWAPWFKTHYTDYQRKPSDFQVAVWNVDHTQLLDEIVKERAGLKEGTYREDQNKFRVRRPSGLVIAGKPDLITMDQDGRCKVYDAKTGSPKQSDIIQVMLYMIGLTHSSPIYQGKQFAGCVVYKSGERSEIPAKAVNKAFMEQVSYFLNILEQEKPPDSTPSFMECRFCDITEEDCLSRYVTREVPIFEDPNNEDPEIPL